MSQQGKPPPGGKRRRDGSAAAKRAAGKSEAMVPAVPRDPAAPSAPRDLASLPPEVASARRELEAARLGLAYELDQLTTSAQRAFDIPAKVRRSPVKAAALAGGAGFLLLGGPRRIFRRVGRRFRPWRRDPLDGLLPGEIERILRDTGVAATPGVREALEQDFAEYLRNKGRLQPNAATSFWRTYDTLVGPLGTVGARILVERLIAADRGRTSARKP